MENLRYARINNICIKLVDQTRIGWQLIHQIGELEAGKGRVIILGFPSKQPGERESTNLSFGSSDYINSFRLGLKPRRRVISIAHLSELSTKIIVACIRDRQTHRFIESKTQYELNMKTVVWAKPP